MHSNRPALPFPQLYSTVGNEPTFRLRRDVDVGRRIVSLTLVAVDVVPRVVADFKAPTALDMAAAPLLVRGRSPYPRQRHRPRTETRGVRRLAAQHAE